MLQPKHLAHFPTGCHRPGGAFQDFLAGHHGQKNSDMCLEFGLIPVAGHQEFGKVFGDERHCPGLVLLIEEREQLIGVAENIRGGGLLLPDVRECFCNPALLKILLVQTLKKCA